MAAKHYVIIGNGPAGQAAAQTLRQQDEGCRISIFSREEGPFYRPHLLPSFIAGKIEEQGLYKHPHELSQEQNIKLRLGQPVVSLDLEHRTLLLPHREMVRFDGLIIAVGGRPRLPEPLAAFGSLMLTLKTVGDAHRWIERLARVDSVFLAGGDLTSLSLTKALLKMDKKVSFLLSPESFWPLRMPRDAFEQTGTRLQAGGVEVFQGSLKSVVKNSDDSYEVFLDDHCLQAGVVGAFFGLVPDVTFLAGSGLQIERGILVDENLNAGFPGVYATGDCAQIFSPELKDYWVSIGYQNAINLGRIAAVNLLGSQVEVGVEPESIFSDRGVKINTSWWSEF